MLAELLDALDVFLDARVQLEDEGLPALAVTQVTLLDTDRILVFEK